MPLMIHPLTYSLISGYRRYDACREMGMVTVRACLPEDVVDACNELGNHVTEPNMWAIPMTVRERVELALRLHELRKPLDHTEGHFAHDTYTAPTVGLSSRILWRIRSTMSKAKEWEGNPGSDAAIARKALKLMLEAVEKPTAGYSANQLVCHLHSMLQCGDVPDSLHALQVPPSVRQRHPVPPSPPLQDAPSVTAVPGTRKRIHADFRLGVDGISGALAGLQSLVHENPPKGDDAEYSIDDLKKSARVIRQIVKSLEERNNGQRDFCV